MAKLKKVSFHSSLVRNPNCTYWGIYGSKEYFEFKDEYWNKTLTIRFISNEYDLTPQFIMAEVHCDKSGDTLLQTQLMTKAIQLLKDFTNN